MKFGRRNALWREWLEMAPPVTEGFHRWGSDPRKGYNAAVIYVALYWLFITSGFALAGLYAIKSCTFAVGLDVARAS